MKEMSKRVGIESYLTNHCFRATSVTVLSDHNCEMRHDHTVESYNGQPSMKQQQKLSPILIHFIGNASSGWATSVQGKENDIQQQCQPIPGKFPHQEPAGKAVLVENIFFVQYHLCFTWQSKKLSLVFLQVECKCPQLIHFPIGLNFEHLRTLQ